MMKKTRKEKEAEILEDDKNWAFLVTFLSIAGYILALIKEKKSDYINFYSNQSLAVFIFAIFTGLIGWIVGWIPVLGWIIKLGLTIITIVLWVYSWMYALSGKMKKTPVVGSFAKDI